IRAFQYLAAYEIVLCTIFTPLFVTLLNDLQVRRFHWLFLVTAMLAVVGTGIPLYHGKSELAVDKLLIGFGLMQLSNLCFAFGQLRYQRVMVGYSQFTDRHVFGYMYVGAVVMAGLAMLVFPPVREVTLGLSREQVGVLVYLGVVASGVGFFLWNIGARRVNAGMLAIMNNAKIPIGIVVSVVVFGEKVAVGPLVVGMGILGVALFLNERYSRSK
ncbi:MAG: EamA family transporter, partial [Phycisphaerales bacterium]|nr:EamA family transporter [Phycisphaerales bacterium]